MKTIPSPPGPRGSLLLGHALEYRRDTTGFLARLAADYGSVVGFRLGVQRFCLLTDPGDIDRVLAKEARRFTKPALLTGMGRLLFGEALTAIDGDAWTRQRRLATPAFRRDALAPAVQLACRHLAGEVEGWRGGEAREVDGALFALALHAYAWVLFGAAPRDTGAVGAAMRRALHGFAARVQGGLPLPDWLPVRANRDMRGGMRVVRACVEGAIEDAVTCDAPSVASALRGARDATGRGYAPRTLIDELGVMWALGAHQTSVGLAWALHLAATHPNAEAQLVREAGATSSDEAALLPFTAGFVDEALRLFPPFPAIVRQPLQPFAAGGYAIDPGTVVMISIWLTQRDARHFATPLAFRPARWTDELRRSLPTGAYLPFGAGPRACIAGALARAVIGRGLLEIVARFRLSEPRGAVVEPAPGVTASVRGGLRLALEQRAKRAA